MTASANRSGDRDGGTDRQMDMMEVTFNMEGESMTLNLQENPHVPSDVPVYVSENGVIQQLKDTESMVCLLFLCFDNFHTVGTYFDISGSHY